MIENTDCIVIKPAETTRNLTYANYLPAENCPRNNKNIHDECGAI